MSSGAYLRYPHLHGDHITFTAADDVWLARADGGRAWRLTRDAAPVKHPRISPDGTEVLFISTRDGHHEVYAVGVDSGEVRRLTWWGNRRTTILEWAADGRLLVSTNAGQVHRDQVVRALSLNGEWERLSYGSATGLALASSGAVALTTPEYRTPAHWKRYRGGTAPKLWLDAKGKGAWTQLLENETAGIVDPMWIGDTLVFVSDRAASFPKSATMQANLWSWEKPATNKQKTLKQLTFQDEATGYVRDATSDGTRITWHSRGEIWVKDSIDASARRLEVTLPGTAPAPLTLQPTENLDRLIPDNGADGSLVSWRGKTFWLTHREGPGRALAADSGVRTREPILLGNTGRAAVVTDAAGEDSLEIHTLDGSAAPERILTGDLGRVLHMASDPAGERLAVLSHDGWVRLVNLESKRALRAAVPAARRVLRSTCGEPKSPSFSPDGRYLLWSHPTTGESQIHRLMVLDTQGDHDPVALTDDRFHDFSPAFTRDGKYIAFLSNRTFDPHYDTHEFSLSFSGATRPWLLPLSASEPPPFGPSSQGWRLSSSPENADGAKAETPSREKIPASPDVDAERAEERVIPFPVPSATYRDLRPAKGALLWVTVPQETGELGSRRAGVPGEQPAEQLVRWDFEERKTTVIVDKLTDYAVSGDGERIVLRHENTVTVQPSTKKVEDDDADRVTVDLSRLRFQLDQQAEWRQMFEEACRLMTQQFWRADMDGVDWESVVGRYRPLVDKARTKDDVVDILWETVGELNTSHAYVIDQGPPRGEDQKLGLLGADLSPADQGWRIDRILPSESSEPQARSPLHAAGVNAEPGDLITEVDGQPVDRVIGPAKHLAGSADKPVELTLLRGGQSRRVVVLPLSDESELRYQDWVRSRREYIAKKTNGRLGYLHVPDMVASGWAQLHRDLRLATRGEGLIADVRYNGGGHTSQLVIARLAQRVVAWARARHEAEAMAYPDGAPRGPVVLVANENSGSDGDIVNAVAQAMDLGPVVGTRTWGGVIGIDGRFDLVDGTAVTQPKYAFWIEGEGWDVENYGVDPDIEVVHKPGQLFSDEDPQLDRAIAEAYAQLETKPAAAPPALPEPKVRS
ncbi:S41 family peptidase [Nesterenkonia natronophila]|uniref:Tricorn protease homolog n=1 Tax=Nesterenkonia natronophila TaxID=2174932 RepID=A0A3A4F791_9MICC|nr:S41 family peptidase [Nesterenkonia natronophila]RJN32360.1 tricorn protease [Nesterenkonia natronophila]